MHQRYFNNKTFSLCLFVTFAFIDFSSSPLQDLGTLVEQLARFLGVSCDKAQLEGMVESCNQLIEQCCNSEALSMCRGEWERKAQLFCSGHRQHKTCTYRLRHQPLVQDYTLSRGSSANLRANTSQLYSQVVSINCMGATKPPHIQLQTNKAIECTHQNCNTIFTQKAIISQIMQTQ